MVMQDWFEQLAPRERLLVIVAGGFLILALIVILGVRPLVANTARTESRVLDQQNLLAELDQVAARLGPQDGSSGAAPTSGAQSLVVVVDRTTRSRGLSSYLKRNQPDGATQIRLRFENAPFDTLVEWLGEVESAHQLTASTANFDRGQEPGRINCNLVLVRAGA